jgi:HPt (histidine-containing phosphotransfer) domain-containing protein
MTNDAFAERLEALRRAFWAQLNERLARMEQLAGDGDESEAELRSIAHKLAGQGGTFGAPEIGRAAAAIEAAPSVELRQRIAELARLVDGR